ncbi:DUF922 domain-containing protein [Falsochrobactrum sp. TDYN1]|uniref:DUF922 domain-containing protein n=1 Tax=Falsochrobactrum tianjinense TaxID=2706015 RepID=A0A949USY7_9HYPH|nr:DUF922 domain-containing protein [Falsochrobactrum sp. TDYN1]
MACPAHADDHWEAVEIIKPYAIAGRTAPQLYESIGARGPKIGKARVIAHTSYVLTWERQFDRSNNTCTVVSATPKLKITYTLPKPSQKLPSPVRENWDVFYEGIRKHELVHGDIAKDMTREIVRKTVGLSVASDPKCQKIRKVLAKEITNMVDVQRTRGRDFDRVEMSSDGNVQQLILSFLNGR